MLPIFVRTFPNGDDAFVHYRWASQFIEALKERGVIYPRWLSSANQGAGSPVMLYYPPLPFFVVAGFNALVGDVMASLSLSCWLAMILSGLTMYAFSRSFLPRWASLFAALFYMIAPYHVFDLYQRSALSEFWAFAWLPLMFDSIYRIATGRGMRAVAYLAASFALLLLTHLPTSFIVALIIPVFALLLTRRVRRLAQIAAGLVLGAGISSVFVVPVLFERGYVRADRILRIRYFNYFLFEQLRDAFTGPLFPSPEVRRFYVVGATNIVALGLPLLLAVSTLVIWSKRRSGGLELSQRNLVPGIWIISALSLLMTTRLSLPIWQVVPNLPHTQFPFRWLLIATGGTVLLTAIALSSLRRGVKLDAICAVIFGVVFITSLAVSSLAITRASYDAEAVRTGLTPLETPEYRPVWWEKQKHWDEEKYDELEYVSVVVNNGEASVRVVDDVGVNQRYDLSAANTSVLRLRQLYFPGWTARVDGKPVEITPSKEGNIELTVVPGEHTLTLNFEDTWPRVAGKFISVFSSLLVVTIIFLSYRFRRKTS